MRSLLTGVYTLLLCHIGDDCLGGGVKVPYDSVPEVKPDLF